jgi:hypothetical protein
MKNKAKRRFKKMAKNTNKIDEEVKEEMKEQEMPKMVEIKDTIWTKIQKFWNGHKWVRVTCKVVGCTALVVGGIAIGESGVLDGVLGTEAAEAVVEAGADVI